MIVSELLEQLDSYQSDTAENNEKFVVSSGIWTRIFGFLDRRALPIELSSQLGLEASLIQFKCTKYFRDDLKLVLEDAQCFNSNSEPSSEIWKLDSY